MVSQATTTSGKQSLKFKEKLVGKSQSSDALVKKMKALHTELSMMDQDMVDTTSLTKISRELIHTSIFLHRDRGVKAYAACCMADLLRLYAPDAPYTAQELRDMFQFFFRQLVTGLKGTDSPWFTEYVYLLESMASIKSICLVPDLPQGDELTAEIFRDFFDLVKLDLSKKVELFMSDILVALIEESPSLPSGTLDVILAQFTPKNARMDHPTFRLAVDVCKATSDRLQGHVAQYFTDTIIQHDADDEEDGADDIQTAHNLIIQINRSCPALLNNVVPQLGEELAVEHIHLRTMATQTLGEMFAENGGESLAQKYPQTWKQWITRTRDKSTAVRVAFIEACKRLLMHHNSLSVEVQQALLSKLLDGEEKVRAAACRIYAQLDYESALHHVDIEQLKQLADRIKDRKSSVRHEALTALGKLFRLSYPEIEAGDDAAITQFGWIPREILAATTGPVDVRASAERAFSKYVLPLPPKGEDEVAWTEQLLVVMRHLDAAAIQLFTVLSSIRVSPTVPELFLKCCSEYNGGIIDSDEEQVTRRFNAAVQQLAVRFPDPAKASEDLNNFAKLNESRLYKLMTTCLDPQTDLKTLVKNMNEFSRRVEQAQSSIHDTMTDLLRRSSLHFVNQSSVPTLVKHLQRRENDPQGVENARTILISICKHCPAIFKPHVAEFSKALSDEQNTTLLEVSLQALASVAKWDASCAPSDKRTLDKAMRFTSSKNVTLAKFATRLIAHSKNKVPLCEQVVENVTKTLDINDEEFIEARLSVIKEMTKSAPDAFEEKSDVIISFLLKEVLVIVPDEINEDEWTEEGEIPYAARLKITAVKICTNRCLAHAQRPSAIEVFKPVFRLLLAILTNMGSIKPNLPDDAEVKARLRLQATCSILKLATIPKYSQAISSEFVRVALMVQDQSFHVRSGFLNRLLVYLRARRLDPRYNVVLFMTALDPEEEIKHKARTYVLTCMQRYPSELRLNDFERPLPRLLHLLAHHPDFSLELESLKDTSDYLDLYFDTVLTAENIHLLTFLAQKVKSVRVDSHTYSENLYAASELAQHKIRLKATRNSWSTNAYPGSVTLPGDIFKALPSPEVATKILKTIYLPEDKVAWLDEQAKVSKVVSKTNQPRKPRAPAANRKRKPTTAKPRRRAKRRKQDDSEEEEGSESEEEDEDPEDPIEEDEDSTPEAEDKPDEDVEMVANDHPAEEIKLGRGAPRKAKTKVMKAKRGRK